MQQILFGGTYDQLSSSATEYNNVSGGYEWNATATYRQQAISCPGTIDRLFVELSADPGTAPDAYTFTLMKNGDATALTCSIVANDTAGSDTAHSVAVAAGDLVVLRCEPVSGPDASPRAQWAMRFTSTNTKESLILGNSYTDNGGTAYAPLACGAGGSSYSATESDAQQVCAAAGTIKNLYVALSIDPGTNPDAYTFTLRVNGVDTTLTCTIVADNTTGNDTAHSVSVSPGDLLSMSMVPVSTPSARPYVQFGLCFAPTTDGQSLILGGAVDSLSASTTEYIRPCAIGEGQGEWSTTEENEQQLGLACTIKNLYIKLTDSPGAGNSYAFTLRNNAGATALTATVSGTDTTANDTAHEATIADGDNLSLQSVPDDTPTVRSARWGMVCYIAPAGWANTFCGVTSPAEAVGVAAASLDEVCGVT